MRIEVRFCNFIVALFSVTNISSGRDASPIIIPDQGIVMGTYLKMFRTQRILAYYGIPYAQPPVGPKRFAPPVKDVLPSWDGIRNATYLQAECWQNPRRPVKKSDEIFMKLVKETSSSNMSIRYDEDCLFLNIFIPDGPPPMEGHAVIVWLHSGDFSSGHSTELDPFQLVFKQKVIIVTVSFRLNIFGFLCTMDGESPGNVGLMDQSAALLWIRRNIKIFGGNPNSITLLGHGSGSECAGLHLFSGEWTDGLFHKVIMMSGSPLSDTSITSPFMNEPHLDAIANAHRCPRMPTSMLIDCLRKLDAQTLAENTPDIDWKPVMDYGMSNSTTPFLADYPRNLLDRGQFRHIPLLIGFTDMEEVMDVLTSDMIEMGITNEMYETLLPDSLLADFSHLESNDTCMGRLEILFDSIAHTYLPYPSVTDPLELRTRYVGYHAERKYHAPALMIANHMSQHATTYVYRFEIRPQTAQAKSDIPDWVGVPHNYDLVFVWGMPYWSNHEMLNLWEGADKRVADIVMTLWVNFAKFTNPTKFGVYINWDEFTAKEHQILIIDRAFNMSDKRNLDLHGVGYWIDHFPKAMALATQCCNASATSYFINPTNHFVLSFPCLISVIVVIIFALPTQTLYT